MPFPSSRLIYSTVYEWVRRAAFMIWQWRVPGHCTRDDDIHQSPSHPGAARTRRPANCDYCALLRQAKM